MATAEPSPEQEPEPEPESAVVGEYEPEPTSEFSGNAEPVPDWDKARALWSWTWQLHILGFGLTFLALAIFSFMRLCIACQASRGKITNAVSLRLILFGCLILTTCFRSVSLLIDPYGSCSILATVGVSMLWSLTFPFLSAGLNLLLFILLETTKLTTGNDHSRNMAILGFATCIYIILTLSTDTVIAFVKPVKGLMLFCQLVFIVWGTVIMVGYCFVGYKVKSNLRNSGTVKKSEAEERRITRFLRLIFSCACTGFCFMAAQLYSIFGVFGVYASPEDEVDPWSWLGFQSFMRIVEIVMCCLIHALVSDDSKYSGKLNTLKINITKMWNSVINRSSSVVTPLPDTSTTKSTSPRPTTLG